MDRNPAPLVLRWFVDADGQLISRWVGDTSEADDDALAAAEEPAAVPLAQAS